MTTDKDYGLENGPFEIVEIEYERWGTGSRL